MQANNFYSAIGNSSKKVSRIFLGLASDVYAEGREQNALLDEMFSEGITAFDTARQYGQSENCLGKWVASRKNREEIFILTKCAHPFPDGTCRIARKEIREDLENSLSALQTDYVDALLLHRDNEKIPAGEIVEWCNELLREGRIRAYGGSNWRHGRIAEANAYAAAHGLLPFSVSSPHYSLAEQMCDLWGGGCVSVTGEENKEARAWYRATGMPLVAYSSLGRGIFSGKVTDRRTAEMFLDRYALCGYGDERNFERARRCIAIAKEKNVSAAQIAVAWLFHSDMNVYAVISSSNASRMLENIQAFFVALSDEECRWLNLGEAL